MGKRIQSVCVVKAKFDESRDQLSEIQVKLFGSFQLRILLVNYTLVSLVPSSCVFVGAKNHDVSEVARGFGRRDQQVAPEANFFVRDLCRWCCRGLLPRVT